jgi:hypothetical protein
MITEAFKCMLTSKLMDCKPHKCISSNHGRIPPITLMHYYKKINKEMACMKKAKKAVGRPKAKQNSNKSKNICVRVTPSTHKIIRKFAKNKDLSITEYVLKLLNVGFAKESSGVLLD